MMDTLLLNANYEPISIIPLSIIGWQQAIKLVFLDKVTVIENYPNKVVRSPTVCYPVPSICVTHEYFNPMKRVKFSRANLYLRDMFQCQYCAEVFEEKELTIDHVIPKSAGGNMSWENCVTACKPCNWKKGSKIQKPLRVPFSPEYYHLVNKWRKRPSRTKLREEWLPYLGLTKSNLQIGRLED